MGFGAQWNYPLLLLMLLTYVEGRVYCQDSNAIKWGPLGYSCPVNCANVITAVRKLKSLDYIRLFSYKNNKIHKDIDHLHTNNNNLQINAIDEPIVQNKDYLDVSNITYDKTDLRKNTQDNDMDINEIKTYKRFYKALNNERIAQDLRNELNKELKECFSEKVKFKFVKISKQCNSYRRSNIEVDFLRKFTAILNRYTHSVPFTEELTAMILKKVLGRNLDLRHGLIDVNKILNFLSEAIRTHEKHIDKGGVIKLRSKHCLTISVMGCYCVSGFVEKSGQCVMPSDCFEGTIEKELLARIIVH